MTAAFLTGDDRTIRSGSTITLPTGNPHAQQQIVANGVHGVTVRWRGQAKLAGMVDGGMFDLQGCKGWKWIEPDVDLGGTEQTAVQPYNSVKNAFIRGVDCGDFEIIGGKVDNLYTDGVWLNRYSGRINIEGTKFSGGGHSLQQAAQVLSMVTARASGQIKDCWLDFARPERPSHGWGGMFFEGVKGNIELCGNTMQNVGRDNTHNHRVGCIDIYGNCEGFNIHNNPLLDCVWQAARIANSVNCRFAHHYWITGDCRAEPLVMVSASTGPCRNVQMVDNHITGQMADTAFGMSGIHSPVEDPVFYGNSATGCRTGLSVFGSYDRLHAQRNRFEVDGSGFAWSHLAGRPSECYVADFLDNDVTGVYHGIFWANPHATGTHKVHRNRLQIRDSGYGVATSSVDLDLVDNAVEGGHTAFYLRGGVVTGVRNTSRNVQRHSNRPEI